MRISNYFAFFDENLCVISSSLEESSPESLISPKVKISFSKGNEVETAKLTFLCTQFRKMVCSKV